MGPPVHRNPRSQVVRVSSEKEAEKNVGPSPGSWWVCGRHWVSREHFSRLGPSRMALR